MKYGLFFIALVGLIACCNDRKANKFTYSEQTNHSLQSGDTVIIDSGMIKDMLVATDSNIAMIPYPDSPVGTGIWAGDPPGDTVGNFPMFLIDSISIHPIKKHKKKHKRWDDGMYMGDFGDTISVHGEYDPMPITCDDTVYMNIDSAKRLDTTGWGLWKNLSTQSPQSKYDMFEVWAHRYDTSFYISAFDTASIKLDSIQTKNDSAWHQFCEKMFKQAEDRPSNGWIKIHDRWSGFDWYWYNGYYHWMQGYMNDPYFDTRYYDSTFRHYTDSIWHVLNQSQIKPQ